MPLLAESFTLVLIDELSGILERLILSPQLNRCVEKAVIYANGLKELH